LWVNKCEVDADPMNTNVNALIEMRLQLLMRMLIEGGARH
jgi:hypothetical protein